MDMQNVLCRKAGMADYEAAYAILREAAKRMVQLGRNQWDENYPQKDDVLNDISCGDAYVLEMCGKVVAYGVVSFDGEPAYNVLCEGKWLSAGPYAVVHRMAVALSVRQHGLGVRFFETVEEMCRRNKVNSIKVDTNYDNVEMLGLLSGLGYVMCGKVYYDRDGGRIERLAFEKIL